MSFIATGDFQAEWSNLDRCQQAWDEILDICKKDSIKLICVLGDLKQAMNPVDVRVIKWWQRAIRKAKKQSRDVLIVLGNHDRVGQYSESDNWLSILRRAGAVTYDKPGIYNWVGGRIFILPFCSDGNAKRGANYLIRQKPNKKKDVLLFHHDITGAKYNKQGSKSDAKLSADDLHCSSYRVCISGHIHMPQRITTRKKVHGVLQKSSIYYVGSPFCHDWGEVNQNKRYLVVGKDSINSTNSRIPGWFDPCEDGFVDTQPKVWDGTRIRIRVSCSASEDYGRRLDRARKEAERRYKGSIVYVIPKFRDGERLNATIKTTDSDEKKIREYVQQARQDRGIVITSSKAISYMLDRLGQFSSGLRGGNEFVFSQARARNFLSFNEVKIDFSKKGITVVQGINYDRGLKCSNGSGKTSFFQTIPVCLFGRTFKEQTHDNWANRWRTKEPAYSRVIGKVSKKNVTISRGRRPVHLRLNIDGKDQSSGMKTTDRNGTQNLIEQVTGYTWQTLANAVYIDRSVTHAFLSGTKKQRTELLSRFQNLERFEKALVLVKLDAKSNDERTIQVRERIASTKQSISQNRTQLIDLHTIGNMNLRSAYDAYQKAKRSFKDWRRKNDSVIKDVFQQSKRMDNAFEETEVKLVKLEKQFTVMDSDIDSARNKLRKWQSLKENKQCPTCFQGVTGKWVKKRTFKLQAKLALLRGRIQQVDTTRNSLRTQCKKLVHKHDKLTSKLSVLNKEKNMLLAMLHAAKQQWNACNQDKSSTVINKTKLRIKKYKVKFRKLLHQKKKLKKRAALYQYAMEAFSRDGIPAFLNRQLCPALNRAADYYSDLFCSRDLQIKFKIEEGEFIPQIINAKGGEGIEDQSTGERVLAGLIASFALREIAPKSNVLFLDEPGEGLDEQYSRQFAKGLRKLSSDSCTIYLATHNVHILSELSGERTITIEKKNKISRIVNV